MNPNFSRRGVVALMTAGALTSTLLLLGCDNVPMNVKIGVAQPLSGHQAAVGQDLLNGVNLAVEELNKESFKLHGRMVHFEVIAVDDKSNAETGKEVAKQLVESGVVAVIGHLNSGVSIAAAPIYAEQGIAQLAISTNPHFTHLGLDTTFRLVANDDLQAKAIGSFAGSHFSGTKYALLDDGTPYGKDMATGVEAQLKSAQKNIVIRQSYDDKTTAFDTTAAKIKAEGVQVVVGTLSDFQLLALIEALKKIDYTDINVLGPDAIKTTEMLKGSDLVKGLYAASPVLEAREFNSGAVFLDKYRAKFKKEPDYAGHYTYDAMYVLAAAIRRAESAKPQDIVASLRKIDGYAPVTGSLKWDDKGEQRYGVIGVYGARVASWESQVRSDSW